MIPTATEIFQWISDHQHPDHIRHEVACQEFSQLRRAVRTMTAALEPDDVAPDIASEMRLDLLRLLTTPVAFHDLTVASLERLGDPSGIASRWGDDIFAAYMDAARGFNELRVMTNPLRNALDDQLLSYLAEGDQVRVYCHRTARPLFESLLVWSTADEGRQVGFLHSTRDYELEEPFDALIIVGPLRTSGFARLPAAIGNAARFRELAQFVWVGLRDDDSFGSDPLVEVVRAQIANGSHGDQNTSHTAVARQVRRLQHGAIPANTPHSWDCDEVELFSQRRRSDPQREAVLVQTGETSAVFYSPHARVLTVKRSGKHHQLAAFSVVSELEDTETFLAWPELGAVDLGDIHARDGHYSTAWKTKLRETCTANGRELERKLRLAGIGLRHLRYCLHDWSQPAHSVIPAPKQASHFEVLIRVLGIESDPINYPRPKGAPWCRLAWGEIARSRGHAIQTGMQQQDIVDEELLTILTKLDGEVRRNIVQNRSFQLPIPPDESLHGYVSFFPILTVEEGYRVPDALLRTMIAVDQAYEWRV